MPLCKMTDRTQADSTDKGKGLHSDKTVQVRADSTCAKPPSGDHLKLDQRADVGGSTKRTVFTKRQLSELEARFREQTFLSKEERTQLAEDLNLTDRQVMIWFQNRRGRLKRRGPADRAYTSDKLKELNTRRPYPFLYGLLSSMQYRYTHHHPYKHLVTGTSTTTPTTSVQSFQEDPRPPVPSAGAINNQEASGRQLVYQQLHGVGLNHQTQTVNHQTHAFTENKQNSPSMTTLNATICQSTSQGLGLHHNPFYHDVNSSVRDTRRQNQHCAGNDDKFAAPWTSNIMTSSSFPPPQIPASSASYLTSQCSNWTPSGTTPITSQNFGFERQIEHFGSMPEFPDILTSGLYAYPSPTC